MPLLTPHALSFLDPFYEVYFTYDKVYTLEMGTVQRVLTNVLPV